jgi:hypothetical protein
MNDLVNELSALRLPELRERYREVLGVETRCPNRTFLVRSICNALRSEETEESETQADDAVMNDDAAVEDAAESAAGDVDDAARLDGEAEEDEGAAEQDAPHGDAPSRARIPRQPRGRFASMTVEELQVKYREVVGRDTGSTDKRYLIWKVREAEKGRIPVGPRRVRERASEPADVKILPLRLEADVVEAMDEAWRSRGMRTRMQFLRRALGHYLMHLGAADAAAKFAGEAAE